MIDRFPRLLPLQLLLLAALLSALAPPLRAAESKSSDSDDADKPRAEKFEFYQDGQKHSLKARVIIEAADGGLLIEGRDGVQWTIKSDDLLSREKLKTPFEPLSHDELAEQLLAELPAGFRTHTTPHYVVCYNTSRAYAMWTSSLLERLHKAFTSYWKREGLELREPEFPLPVLVFADAEVYDQASRQDIPNGTGVTNLAAVRPGQRVVGIVGFYSLRSNRINMFDLTGAESLRDNSNRRGSLREINQMLSQPAAVPLVATIVHEATHQIAFNCGLQTRYADIPLWLCEGMAVYFEAPDLTSTRGWRGIGRVNYPRLEAFHANLPRWQAGSLERMLASDERFRNPQTSIEAYADAWALNYYLIKYESEAYADYLKTLTKKRPYINDNPKKRLDDFRKHFGDPARMEQKFLKQMSRIR